MKKTLLFLFVALLCKHADAQCGPYINYAACNDSLGLIYYNASQCSPTTQIIWSTGDTAFSIQVPPGVYQANSYAGNVYICTDNITMYHDTWNLTVNFAWVGTLGFYAELPFCNTSIFTHPSCGPPTIQSSTLIIWEDGIPVDTIYNAACTGDTHVWSYAQPGHCYDLSVYDTTCNCYQATWMYSPPRTYCYPLVTSTQNLLSNINPNNLRYKIINPLGQIIEQGKFSGEIILRNGNHQLQPGIYFVIYSDADDNRQVLTDKVMVSNQ